MSTPTSDPAGPADTGDAPAGTADPVDPAPARPGLGWTEIAVAAVAYVVLSIGLGVVAVLLGGRPSPAVLVGLSGVAALGAVAVAVAVRVRSASSVGLRPTGRSVGLRPTSARWLLVGVAGGIVGWLLTRGAVLAYQALTGDTTNPQQGMADLANSGLGGLLLILGLGAVLVPVGEELLFRGVLFGALRRYGTVPAVGASAVVFGLAHGISVVLPAAIVLGVVNAELYRRSGSIWPAVVAHAVNNALVFTLAAVLL